MIRAAVSSDDDKFMAARLERRQQICSVNFDAPDDRPESAGPE
jgi:hypothetical protein